MFDWPGRKVSGPTWGPVGPAERTPGPPSTPTGPPWPPMPPPRPPMCPPPRPKFMPDLERRRLEVVFGARRYTSSYWLHSSKGRTHTATPDQTCAQIGNV